MVRNKQIVCISSHYWEDRWFRKQHFMSRFHKEGYKVAYIEPSFSMLRKAHDSKKIYMTNGIFNTKVKSIDKNFFVIKLPKYLPFWTKPLISKLNFFYLSLHINFILERLGFKDYVLWNYIPQFAIGLSMFNYRKLVFDIVDDLAAYNYDNKSKYEYIKTSMEYLAKNSDLVLVTASSLFENYKNISSNVFLVPNGYDSKLFGEANVFSDLLDMKDVSAPIIGFVGTIFSYLDLELLKYVIQCNQDKSFVFIGSCEFDVQQNWLSIIKNYKNVFWLGKKKKEEIPRYIDKFDVCINPFKVDQVSRSVSPLKVFEYLAMKKPVISVRMESLEKEKIAQFIYFASSYKDFNEKINVAINDKNEFKKRLNYEIVKTYSWDDLFSKVYNLVTSL